VSFIPLFKHEKWTRSFSINTTFCKIWPPAHWFQVSNPSNYLLLVCYVHKDVITSPIPRVKITKINGCYSWYILDCFFFPLYNGIKLPVVANDDLSSSITLREIIELNGANWSRGNVWCSNMAWHGTPCCWLKCFTHHHHHQFQLSVQCIKGLFLCFFTCP
jgi:hypothetical protein